MANALIIVFCVLVVVFGLIFACLAMNKYQEIQRKLTEMKQQNEINSREVVVRVTLVEQKVALVEQKMGFMYIEQPLQPPPYAPK